jgi:hypothetical protein
MRQIITLLFIPALLLFSACNQDEDMFEGAAISFYPTVIANGTEEDGQTYLITLGTSAYIQGTGRATIQLNTSAEGVLSTVPAMDGNTIQVEINNNNEASILVTIENDAVPDDYVATFSIVNVSGEIVGIGRSKFSLFVKDTDVAPVYVENFDDCNNLNSFTPYSVTGAQGWVCTNFGRSGTAARMNGFAGGVQENEDWLISEPINLVGLGTASARFVSDKAFTGANPEFKVSTNYSGTGDPNAATWVTLDADYDTQSGNDTWTPSGNMDISDYLTDATYFAFVYKSNATLGAAQWTIDDFEISIFHPNASGGGNDNLASLPFEDDFEACTDDVSTPDGWEEWFLSSKNDNGWGCRTTAGVDDSRGVRVSAFNGEVGTIDTWLISESKFDLRNLTSGTLTFDVRSTAGGDGTLTVLYSTNYFREGPALATWTALDIASQLPAKDSDTFVNVGADIPGGDMVYVAFRFTGGSEINSTSYDIDNVAFTPFEFGTLPFTEGFDGCGDAGTFNIPANWIEVNVPGSKTDRGWGCNANGRSGSGMRASAYGGADGFDNAWLISEGKFNFTELTNVTLSFWVEDRFVGPGELAVKWSADYPGTGNPESYTWITLADVDAQLPGDNSTVYTQVTSNLNAAAGQQVYIAFQYTEGTNDAAGAFTIDDVQITGN